MESKQIKLQLLINDISFCSLEYSSDRRIDIQYLMDKFIDQIKDVLKNGYYKNETIVDAINNDRFIGWDITKTKL